jgi:hypothetical protein
VWLSASQQTDTHPKLSQLPQPQALLPSHLLAPVLFASVVVDVIAVFGVLPAVATTYSAAAATWALFSGMPGQKVAEQAAFGLAVGFLVGIPIMISAGLALALGS